VASISPQGVLDEDLLLRTDFGSLQVQDAAQAGMVFVLDVPMPPAVPLVCVLSLVMLPAVPLVFVLSLVLPPAGSLFVANSTPFLSMVVDWGRPQTSKYGCSAYSKNNLCDNPHGGSSASGFNTQAGEISLRAFLFHLVSCAPLFHFLWSTEFDALTLPTASVGGLTFAAA